MAVSAARFRRFTSRFTPVIDAIASVLGVIAFVAAVTCLVELLLHVGFEHSTDEIRLMNRVLKGCQIAFLTSIIFNLVFRYRNTVRHTRIVKWIVDTAVLITLLPLVYPHPEQPWIPVLEHVLYNRTVLYAILASYSAVDISYGIVKLAGKHTNPSLLLSASFLLFIIAGSFVLMMPRFTVSGISYIDSLFVSTSAVCITGLTTVDVSQTFTLRGLVVLGFLIQAGGLGIMTFTSFFALFFSGNTSIYSQLMVKDMIYSKTMSSLIPTLLLILGFTLVIEALGAVAFFLALPDTLQMATDEKIAFSLFHSLSAFCNAGFSNLEGGMSNPALLHSNQSVYIVASVLIAAGGIGFPTLMNLKLAGGRALRRLGRRLSRRPKPRVPSHIYDLNTKIVLVSTGCIFAASALLFFIFEYDNALSGFSFGEKVVQSVFNAWVPRSSGFSSVNPAEFLNITLVMFVLLMWIGGASQSTAGGIKINTFSVMLLNLRAMVYGRNRVTAFGRTISTPSLRRAHAVIGLSIVSYVFFAMTLIGLEPKLPARDLLYEAASALFTVGSSLGVTPELGSPAKMLLCAAMFLGRVGILSLLAGIAGRATDSPARLPEENIIIN